MIVCTIVISFLVFWLSAKWKILVGQFLTGFLSVIIILVISQWTFEKISGHEVFGLIPLIVVLIPILYQTIGDNIRAYRAAVELVVETHGPEVSKETVRSTLKAVENMGLISPRSVLSTTQGQVIGTIAWLHFYY